MPSNLPKVLESFALILVDSGTIRVGETQIVMSLRVLLLCAHRQRKHVKRKLDNAQ